MKRRLFTILSALSLMLCVATCVLWAREGYYLADLRFNRFPRPGDADSWFLRASSYSGTLQFELDRRRFATPYLLGLSRDEQERFRAWYPAGIRSHFLGPPMSALLSVPDPGFHASHYAATTNAYGSKAWVLGIPDWLLIILLLVLPAVRLHYFRKNCRAKREGLCRICGYDLRASPDRCPECGTVPKRKLAVK